MIILLVIFGISMKKIWKYYKPVANFPVQECYIFNFVFQSIISYVVIECLRQVL